MNARNRQILCLTACLVFTSQCSAQSLRYRWQSDQELVYVVDVTADLPDKTETLTGAMTYKLQAEGDPAKVTYHGGLTRSVKNKPGARTSSPPGFGPFGLRFGGPPSPFAPRPVNPFKGLEKTTGKLTLDSSGGVLAMEGTSHLPYLLGHLSLLVFEPLPEGEQDSWKFDSGVTISEKSTTSQRSRFDPFGPFGPFGRTSPNNAPEKISAGSQVLSFALKNSHGDLSTFTKTFQMNSPGGDVSLSIDGNGTWTFNRKLGVPESTDFTQQLTITKDNVSIVVPITIKYRRLTPEQWKQYEKDRLAEVDRQQMERLKNSYKNGGYLPSSNLPVVADMQLPVGLLVQWKKDSRSWWPATVVEELPDGTVKAKEIGFQRRGIVFDRGRLQLVPKEIDQPETLDVKQVAALYLQGEEAARIEVERDEQHQLQLEAVKAKPEASIPDDQRSQLLATLKSGDYRQIQRALQLISVRTPRPDPELQKAIEPLVGHMDTFLQKSAKAAMLNCAPDLKRVADLNRSYHDFNFTRPVKEMGPAPTDETPLPPGLIVAGEFHRRWRPATIVRVREDGKVDVKFGPHAQTRNRADLRLAPPEVDQPNVDPQLLAAMKSLVEDKSGDTDSPKPEKTRTWKDASGSFELEATYLGVDGDNVLLKRSKDDREIKVPLARLSQADQEAVKALQKPSAPDNPFEP